MNVEQAIKVTATGDVWSINQMRHHHIELMSNGKRVGMSTIEEVENFIETGMGVLIDDETVEWTVEIGTWVNGVPTTVESWRTESYETGHKALWNIGHSRDYGVQYAGYLKWKGEIREILTIRSNDTWGISKRD